ncbi:MAG: signal peptide peptidase SppA [Rikenellaceae bacterium]
MGTFKKTFWAAFLAFFAANIAISIFTVIIVIGTLASVMMLGGSSVDIDDDSILRIDLSKTVSEQGAASPLGSFDLGVVSFTEELALLDVVSAIDNAASDKRIKGIYIDVPLSVATSSTNLEEIRSALLRFKNSGKFITSYSEFYPQAGYYLASVADDIFVNPEGGVAWHGMSANVMFLKNLLDKLQIEAQVIRHGQFKSAIEPYILSKMSPENRMQYTTLLETLWGTVVSDVSESLGVDSALLVKYANDLRAQEAKVALECKMVTELKYQDQVSEFLIDQSGSDDDGKPNFVELSDYISDLSVRANLTSSNHIAVIYASGGIISGDSENGNIGSKTLSEQLAKVREDDDVKAVVLRVNSPGGSALASEVMWREIELVRKQKPVIVSMGAYAASGGYYISCPADVILSNRMTLTGSIGVYGVVFNAQKGLNNKLGITFDGVKTGASADMGVPYRPLSTAEKAVMQKSVENVYSTFTKRVADGRNLSVEQVDKIGGGRVWSGVSAMEVGLIDGFGGLSDAILLAADRAGVISDYRIVGAVEKEPIDMLLEALAFKAKAKIDNTQAGELYNQSLKVEQMMRFSGVQTLSPILEIEM